MITPAGILGTWEGEPAPVFASLLTGLHLEDVSLVGEGIVDGRGNFGDWWNEPKLMRKAWRPKLIFFAHCKNIILHGLTLKNSPSWTIHPYFSDHLSFLDLTIINPKDSPNTDGINPDSCHYVNIIGCSISAGDDCIALKSGKPMENSRFLRTTKKIVIRNCLMEYGHGAVTLGSEMSGGIRELYVSQCLFTCTDRGLRIKTRRGRGKDGIIDNITFENIRMKGVFTPFVINMFYHCDADGKEEYVWSKDKLPLDEKTPQIGTIVFKNIMCEDCEVAALFFYGLPEQKIGCVYLENIHVSFKNEARKDTPAMMSFIEPVSKMGMYINQAKKVVIKDITLSGHNGEPYIFDNIDNLVIK
jgi:polygalacturonase